MILNRFEYALMNSPLRAAVQRHVEAKRLVKMGGPIKNQIALEIGCGRGIGVDIIIDIFGASHVDAFDLDPKMIDLARKRRTKHAGKFKIWQGDATAIETADNYYDAVFDFGIIHHIPEWRKSLGEIYHFFLLLKEESGPT